MTKEEILKDIRAIDDKDNPLLRCDNDDKALLYIVEKTAERTKREMIEKAADWIGNMVIEYLQGDVTHIFTYEMISDFRKSMQDESK
jgi:hypothetical protein